MASTFKTISIDKLDDELGNLLNDYSNDVVKKTKAQSKVAIQQLVKETKAKAPKRRPRYFRNISYKKTSETLSQITYTWYVKGNDYRLSHLLEFGHATRNGGRTEAQPFIKPSADKVCETYYADIKNIIKGSK